jgi:hypothetical protein
MLAMHWQKAHSIRLSLFWPIKGNSPCCGIVDDAGDLEGQTSTQGNETN